MTFCPIQIQCQTRSSIKKESLTFDTDGKPTETYDSIIRRAVQSLAETKKNKVDVNKL
jgi:hypothetical protein